MKKQTFGRWVVFTSLTLFTSLMVCAVVLAQTQKPPAFRSRVDLMQLDVTALDKNGQPVRGLTAADFTLLEDNQPQTIEAFSAVDLPDRVADGPVWESRAVRDVATNNLDNQRIIVIVLDDALGMGLWGKRAMKASATQLIEAFGAKDLAAVVFTGSNYRASQNLTTDRARLIQAVQSYPDNDANLPQAGTSAGFAITGRGVRGHEGPCLANKEILRLFESMVTHLSTLPDRRKAIVYFGSRLPWAYEPRSDSCGTYGMWRDVFAAAQTGHVTINPVNTAGFTGGTPDHYLAVADNTGGRAVINENGLWPGIQRILAENSSYYLLAYQPTNPVADGTFRRLTVKVNRPDVEIHTRRNYWAPRAKDRNASPAEPSEPEIEALAGVLPLSSLALRVAAAPFAVARTGKSVVTLALGVQQLGFADQTPEEVEVLVKAFTATGDPKGSETQTISLMVPRARLAADATRYEVLTRIELPKPGKYELRLSAHSAATETRGSVYMDLEVPDFRKDTLSLSGVVLSHALPPMPVAPARALQDVIPVTPTAERMFAPSDPVVAFLRVYQGGKQPLAPTTVTVQIQDATGKSVFEKADSVAVEQFNAERAAEYQMRLPLSTLTAGEYLLTFEATAGAAVAKRDVRFQVK